MVEHNSNLAKREPSWASVDKTALPVEAFAHKTEQVFPHHWVRGPTLFLHKQALSEAWASANGAGSGRRAAAFVLAHLRKHFAALGIKKVMWDGQEYDVTIFDAELRAAGLVKASELEIEPGAYAIRILGGLE